MTRFILLLAILASLPGCLSATAVPEHDAQSAVRKVSPADFGSALAKWIESDEAATTDEVYKVAQRSAAMLGMTCDMGEYGENRKLTDELRRELATKARGLK